MKDNNPLISIITVVYNGRDFLEKTIRSVINQSYKNIEYIIIDGGSNDGTVDIIKRYEDKIDYWVSEKDDGIYDAMNKGIKIARGEYIAFINADDWYEEEVLQEFADILQKHNNIDILAGDISIVDEEGKPIVVRKGSFEEYGKNLHHQAIFVSSRNYKQLFFDTSYHLAADSDFIVKVMKTDPKVYKFDRIIANFRQGGKGSDMIAYQKELFLSNRQNIGYIFALKRLFLNLFGRMLFNIIGAKR
jgi:glycosyltransferase involved in cell wall biosynthesis